MGRAAEREHVGNELGIVREVSIHRQYSVGPGLEQGLFESHDVGGAKTQFGRPVHDKDPSRVVFGPAISLTTGPVGRVVVHHDRTDLSRQCQQLLQQFVQIVGFIVGGHNDVGVNCHRTRSAYCQ